MLSSPLNILVVPTGLAPVSHFDEVHFLPWRAQTGHSILDAVQQLLKMGGGGGGGSLPWACWLHSLTQPRTQSDAFAARARCCLCSICCSSGPPSLLLQSIFLDNWPPACTAAGLLPPRWKAWNSLLVSILRILSAHFSSLARSPWIAALPFYILTTPLPFLIHKIAS